MVKFINFSSDRRDDGLERRVPYAALTVVADNKELHFTQKRRRGFKDEDLVKLIFRRVVHSLRKKNHVDIHASSTYKS